MVIKGELSNAPEKFLSLVPSVNINPTSFKPVASSFTDLMLIVVPVYTESLTVISVLRDIVSLLSSSLQSNVNASSLVNVTSDAGAFVSTFLSTRLERCFSLVFVGIPSSSLLYNLSLSAAYCIWILPSESLLIW